MITDQGRWDDRDYYDEHFYDIMYDKITEGMKLTVDEMDNLVSAGLFDKEIVPHEEYLEVNDNNQKMRTIVKLHDKYFEIRWTQYTHKDSEFPNDPVEVRKKPKIIDDWIPVDELTLLSIAVTLFVIILVIAGVFTFLESIVHRNEPTAL